MSQLSSSQIDRALCKIQGFNNFKRMSAQELSCVLDLELLEKFSDFSFVSGTMLRYAVEHDGVSELKYEGIESPLAKMQLTMDMPLSPLDKIIVDEDISLLCRESHTVNSIKTEYLLPDFYKFVQEKQEALREQEKADAETLRQERLKAKAERKAALKNKKGKKAATDADAADAAAEESADKTALDANATAAQVAANAATAKEQSWSIEYQAECAAKHRYAGRKVQLHLFEDWQHNASSLLWSITLLQHHFMMDEDDGLPDVLRDVIVYEWVDKRSEQERLALGMGETLAKMSSEELYECLRLSDVVLLPDGKVVMWYSLDAKGPIADQGVEGFGVDIDPPFMQNYATGIKHVFAGSLDQHPTVQWYRQMLASKELQDVVQSVHYSPCDNISPYSEDETAPEMLFINNGYLIFVMELTPEVNHVPEKKTIEVLVKEQKGRTLESVVEQLKSLKNENFSDFEGLVTDIVDLITDPLVEMKNDQEAKRRARDEEYQSYTFKDPINRSEFTKAKLMRNFPLTIDRVVLSSEEEKEVKFILQSDLFAYKDADDDRYQGENNSLGMVHADAIVVSLGLNGDGYDFNAIDLADCVQIPFGAHKNADAEAYQEKGLTDLLSDLDEPLPEGWQEAWAQAVSEYEVVQPEVEGKGNRKSAANNKRKRKK